MGSPTIFNGKFTKLLTGRGMLRSDGGILEYNGPRNYIANSHFEQNLTGWSLFNTTQSGTLLPNGTISAGAASLTQTLVATNVLSGSNSMQIAAASAWTAGQGFISTAFTVDNKDLGKMLTLNLSYQITTTVTSSTGLWSGVLGNQSIGLFVYDVTASQWVVPPGGLGFTQTSGSAQVTATFQTSVTVGQQYQVAVFCMQGTSAITFNFDEITVTPQMIPLGSVTTDWQSYTPTILGLGTVSPLSAQWRRVGDSAHIQVNGTAGTPTAVNLSVSLPTGLTSDNSGKLSSGIYTLCGEMLNSNSGAILKPIVTNNATSFAYTYNAVATTPQLANGQFTAGSTFSFNVIIPISGWSSNVQMSSDTDTRVVAMQVQATLASATVTSSFSLMKFTSGVITDTHAAYSTTSGLYTVPVTGYYRCTANAYMTAASYSVTGQMQIGIVKNGTVGQANSFTGGGGNVSVNVVSTVFCNAGDTLAPYVNSSQTTPAMQSDAKQNYFMVERVSGPAVIAASESVNMSASGSSTSMTSGANTQIVFTNKEWDTHNAYSTSTGTFTVPVSGKYTITTGAAWTSATSNQVLFLYKNGSSFRRLVQSVSSGSLEMSSAVLVACNAGDTIAVYGLQLSGGTVALDGSTANNWMSIARVGN